MFANPFPSSPSTSGETRRRPRLIHHLREPFLWPKTCAGVHGGHSPLHASLQSKIISPNATCDQREVTLCPPKLDTPMARRRGQAGLRDWRRGLTVIRMIWQPRRGSCCFRVGRRRDTTRHQIVQVRNELLRVRGEHCSWWSAGAPYDIEIFVSGYVVKHKTSNTLSRSQRTLLKLAKSWFAPL